MHMKMYVHFFGRGRMRIVSSSAAIGHVGHPIIEDDPSAAAKTTSGTPIAEIFPSPSSTYTLNGHPKDGCGT